MGRVPIPPDYRGLDRVIHERGRLAIMALLSPGPLSFVELKERLGMTDGNLSRHLLAIQRRGYIACARRFGEGRPRTDVRITAAGERAFATYAERIQAILALAGSARGASRGRGKR
ncbi:MAG: transcriptional regulator [Planctomycetes bacterium]|nr:transcriptional regulator [Planctomycetota bacterium]